MKLVRLFVSTPLLVLALAACSGESTEQSETRSASVAEPVERSVQSNYVLPPKDTKSLVSELTAKRDATGAVVIEGTVRLPPGTKLRVERRSQSGNIEAQSDAFVDDSGFFSSQPFSDSGKPPKEGPHRVIVISYFNKAWQSDSILNVTGEGGVNLPPVALTPNDPEFPNASGYLEETRRVTFPPVSEEIIAVDRVKNAKLYVQGQGQAVDTVAEIVTIFAKSPGFKPIGWSAEKSGAKWVVTLESQEGAATRKAQWEYDPTNGKVRYLDPLSKLLSWIPAE